jgi:superfamily II DNA/RNA helicase
MASNAQELQANIEQAIAEGFRGNLLARGQSRSMIWRDGLLPEDAPEYSGLLSHDLLSYSYSLLSHGLRLIDLQRDSTLARAAFEHTAEALEAVIARSENNSERDFHRVVAAAAYHLGGYSAKAYSLLHASTSAANLTLTERSLAKLMLRDFDGLSADVEAWKRNGSSSDEAILKILSQSQYSALSANGLGDEERENALIDAMNLVLNEDFLSALGSALLAFERGERFEIEQALSKLTVGLESAAELNLVAQWWCHRLAIHLLRGLWDTSFHERLPELSPFDPAAEAWSKLRKLFIGSLYRRQKSEIELWPSQLEAAHRVLEFDSNLVLSLPTSAGKTRIAELCILACLAKEKRVVFVTPLRALSAQTEVSLQRTFQPLGKTVSSLYGSIGTSIADVDVLRGRDIIVATPEKLDFALRNDPSLFDDVGLLVLDEGHMIGLNEREVRYEAQIQRLLRRDDAAQRRIVCLSAILPEGDQLEDFAAWLTCDKPNGLIKNKWRPTRLRYGEVVWKGSHAQLTISVGDEKPFIPKFLSAVLPPKRKRTKLFPKDQRELCLATAWRLVEDGQTVLIFCPRRISVLPYAKAIVDLHSRGALTSIFDVTESVLASALTIGAEWLGAEHVILKCLKLGVAIHHGALPSPYRKEVEKLLRDGILKVTVSSPTLAQGLNLSATCLLFHGLSRTREPIDISEFRNVVGRAGRAYVDIEGLVLYPMFDNVTKHRREWNRLINNDAGREMESGLLRLLVTLLLRMAAKLKTKNIGVLLEYVAGNSTWDFPDVDGESPDIVVGERNAWKSHIASLDTALLSLLGDQPVGDNEIEARLDDLLAGSLFKRRLDRRKDNNSNLLMTTLVTRAKYIWTRTSDRQRRGYFLAGVGFETGQQLDARASELEALLVEANQAILTKDDASAVHAITRFAEVVFAISPFIPEELPQNWKEILNFWLHGEPLAKLAATSTEDVLSFVEHGLVYKLPWAMEAVRVRGIAHESLLSDGLRLSEYELKFAVAAVETGTLDTSAAYLMQSGFSPRLAAMKAVQDGVGQFNSSSGLEGWLGSEPVKLLTQDLDWPTPETHSLWLDFLSSFKFRTGAIWERRTAQVSVAWISGKKPDAGTPLRIGARPGSENVVLSASYELLGTLTSGVSAQRSGLLLATASAEPDHVDIEYLGPNDLQLE